MKLSQLSLRKKVNSLGIFIILLFSVILFLKVLPLLETGKLEERRGKLKAVVNTVVSLMNHYEKQLRKEAWKTDPTQPKTIEEAKQLIIKNLKHMRYDKTEYFFILDGKGYMIMHPLKPALEGQYMMDTKGPKGEPIFHDLVLSSQRDSDAFVSYIWQSKYSPLIFEPQTTYAKYFWAWDWIVCSGVYTQDILDSMEEINYLSAGYVVVTSVFTVFILLLFVYFNLSKPLMNLLNGIEEIKKDNLEHKVNVLYEDELGHITRQFNTMIENRKQSQKELLQLNESLETKVIERTAELSDTLKVVQDLKVKQDGDYFLTSLLLKPLQSEGIETADKLKCEIFVKQYKQFTFRSWNSELGGDICIAESLTLQNRNYLFFVNADAMGKSIQGAGGALIFGTTVKAALIRTKMGSSPNVLPEIWLKNLYTDLDELFTTFDGTMLMSAVMGLIDEENGVTYFLNMEHPYPVLYRDGKASFLSTTEQLTKIGTPEKEFNIMQVNIFQLKSNDILILGSDGRDDIILAGTSEVNHDETLFLKVVEGANAIIPQIVDNLTKIGELKDDLSLITIQFSMQNKLNPPEMTEEEKKILLKATTLHRNNKNQEALVLLKKSFNSKYLLLPVFNLIKRIYLVEKDYLKYSELLMRYHIFHPEQSENLLKISKALVLCNRLESAIEYSESLRTRDPFNEENLLHLAKTYKFANLYNSALRSIEELLRLNPMHEEGLVIKENIKNLILDTKSVKVNEQVLKVTAFSY